MRLNNIAHLVCPSCKRVSFSLKYEATYVYSYVIDGDAPGRRNKLELLPFMFDNREQKEAKQFLECNECGLQVPCYFDKDNRMMDFASLQHELNIHHIQDQ
ncbi:MAG: hypothetical protein N2484_13475 [Clostridia bacterium]|nr:hypothetical protein [Clostridia bacterium]